MIQHNEMVKALVKPGADILATLTPEKVNAWHLATGVAGESGELLDAVKKYVAYNKALDRENVVEEMGDIEFYLEGLRQGLGITREEVITHNIYKLALGPNARYKGGYSDKAAVERSDKAVEGIEP